MTLQTENFEDLSDDELEARQRADDEARAAKDTATPDPEADKAVVEGADKTEPEHKPEPVTDKVAGVASKDGTRVLPYAALQSERRNARQNASRATRAEQERDALKQQLEDVKAGKVTESTQVTDEDLAELEADFPERGRKIRAEFERLKGFEPKQSKPDVQENDDTDDPLQDAIDQVPLLVGWQHEDAEKFGRAQAIDNALKGSPKWRDRPVVERFAHVARQVADEYDIPLQEEQTSNTPPSRSQEAIETAARAKPNTLSDFKGGAAPDHGNVDYDKMSPAAMLNRFNAMTNDEMDAHLARLG